MPVNTKELTGKYHLVLGLEIHMHLKTEKKMFCGCSADIYADKPNTHTCPVCLGLPGALPVPNYEAVKKTQMLGLAMGCTLLENTRFDRKHYFYPDLPKGYQISQYKQPLCGEDSSGVLERIHLEEDTAKSFHSGDKTLIDFNKSGMPLIEIVTKPVFDDVDAAVEFAKKLRDLARFLGVSDADMEKGQLRIEPNISLRSAEQKSANKLPDYKVEVKNINSFRFMEKAVVYEIKRQREALESGEKLAQENRGYDEKKDRTVSQRSKEDAEDYRYFPEPDIPPMVFDKKYFDGLKRELPELPEQVRERLKKAYGLSEKTAQTLTTGAGLDLVGKFEEIAKELHGQENMPTKGNKEPIPEKSDEELFQKIANVLLNKTEYRDLTPKQFLDKLKSSEATLDDHSELEKMVDEVISENSDAAANVKAGKTETLQFLIGQVMKKTKGKANPQMVREMFEEKLV